MRLKIEGKHSIDVTLQILHQQLEHLIKKGMVDVSGFNVYLTPINTEGEEVIFIDEHEQEIGMMVWKDKPKRKEVKVDRKKVEIQRPSPILRSVA